MLSATDERELEADEDVLLSELSCFSALAALRRSSAARRSSMLELLLRALELPMGRSGRSLSADDMSALLSRCNVAGGVGRAISPPRGFAGGERADEDKPRRPDSGRSFDAAVRSERSSARSLSGPVARSIAEAIAAPAMVFDARPA